MGHLAVPFRNVLSDAQQREKRTGDGWVEVAVDSKQAAKGKGEQLVSFLYIFFNCSTTSLFQLQAIMAIADEHVGIFNPEEMKGARKKK